MIKLSELSTDKFLDKTCELVPYFVEIVKDDEIIKVITEKTKPKEGATKEEVQRMAMGIGIDKVAKLVPLLLKEHRADIYGIISVMNEKEVEEIANQNSFITFKEVKDLFMDKDLNELFLSLTA